MSPWFVFSFAAKPAGDPDTPTLLEITVEVQAKDPQEAHRLVNEAVTIRQPERFKPSGGYQKTVYYYAEGE